MPQFDKFKASVVVDGEALPEYSTTSDEATKTIACWIPSQEGKAFSINFESEIYPTALEVAVMVDGEYIGARCIRPRGIPKKIQFAEIAASSTTSRDLFFSRIELTDDDAFLNANVKGLGEISLSVWEGTYGGPVAASIRPEVVPEKKIHERSKKAMGHQVKFGEEKVTEPRHYCNFTRGELVATFIFKYRSIDILRADGIAPPDPAANKRKADEDPEDEDDDNDDDDGDADADRAREDEDEKELKDLLEKINTIQSKLAKKVSKKTKSKKKVKTELRPLLISGEVIDLT